MKEVVSIKANNAYPSGWSKKTPSFMAKITLFAQVIQKLPKELINLEEGYQLCCDCRNFFLKCFLDEGIDGQSGMSGQVIINSLMESICQFTLFPSKFTKPLIPSIFP